MGGRNWPPIFINEKGGDSIFDVSTISKRYFSIKIGEVALEVEPPKIKTLKQIMSLSKSRDASAINDLASAVSMVLSKNKTGYAVSEDLIDELDLDQMNEILTAYFGWLVETKNLPN